MSNSNTGWMDRVLDALRSPGAMMVALVLALFPQGEHTAQVFIYFSHDRSGNAQLFAYAFAAAVEVAVLLFVLAGHKRISYLFAGASFLTNVVYYAIGGVAMLTVSVLPVLLLSALLPACIMGYSHTIADTPNAPATHAPAKPITRRRWQFWRKPTGAAAANTTANTTTPTPIAPPSESGGHSEGAAQTSTPEQARDGSKSKVSPETKAIILRSISNGAKVADVATEFDVSPNTVRSWIARTAKQTNGVH